jgi:hypothetical protein
LVCGAFDECACGNDLFEVVDSFLVVELAGCDGGDPRRVGVTSSALTRPIAWRGLTFSDCAEKASRGSVACSVRKCERVGSGRTSVSFPGLPFSLTRSLERAYQAIDLGLAVREGNPRHDPAVVNELYVHHPLVA